jgi:hypothetical protein
MREFVFGQADRGLVDLVTNVTLVFSDVRTVLRMGFHMIFQLRSRFAVLVAIRAMQTHLKTANYLLFIYSYPQSIYILLSKDW